MLELVPEFEVVVSDVDEEALTTDDPWETAENLSLAKATAVSKLRPDTLVIGGDTVVAIDNEQLAKPENEEHARVVLRRLSGATHMVITGITLIHQGQSETFSVTSHVSFRELSDEEIREYIATGEPMDKAGAYAIQGGASAFVSKLEGSLSNVIGLPLEALRDRLGKFRPQELGEI